MLRNGPEEHYTSGFDFDLFEEKQKLKLLVATLPRTGSTQLCIELWKTGVAGAPLEYLNLALRRHDMIPRLSGGNVVEYWKTLTSYRTSANGVFSFKAFTTDFQQVSKSAKELMPLIRQDRIVYLTRKDKLLQAISWARAQQTNRWFFNSNEQKKPIYDTDMILKYIDQVAVHEKAWEAFFEKERQSPLRIYYEDFQEGSDAVIHAVLSHMGVEKDPREPLQIKDMEIQRDELTLEWAERFKAEVDFEEL